MAAVPGGVPPETELLAVLKKSLYERTRRLDPTQTLELIQHLKEWVAEEVTFEEGAAASLGRLLSELSFSQFVDQLPPLMNSFERLVSAYFVRRGSVSGFYSFCNVWRERLIRRTLLLAEEGLELNDLGRPPAPYALLASGMAGRREQTLEDASRYFLIWNGDPADYFNQFAYRILAILQQCSLIGRNAADFLGKVLWRGSYGDWECWVAGDDGIASDEPSRRLELLADLRFIAGDHGVGEQALRQAQATLERARGTEAYQSMAQRAIGADLALTIAGNVRLERSGVHAGCVDLTAHAMRPLVSLVRFLAVQHGLEAAPTAGRIEALEAIGALEEDLARALSDAHDLFGTLKIRKEIALQPPYVDPAELTPAEQQRLRAGLESVRRLQKATRRVLATQKRKPAEVLRVALTEQAEVG
ncbi:DUF294 nucleotidyltransferase-like domain-containing protein [Geomonas sp. RF6]|uniref:putative nucleotidyltransferase substrate binding domain-containing protein n=1 Tax=Geomonas sp. RF6 TaxID=2897342 RepID=UPI001E57792D|nr:putative nucleotidyltransferase substrate binding domain-containing protein [Geomonas sp. RF6]UFS68865.1 DUF294 nucleotidyltransferase-like domain-containing protein [Geomonas sp. RF6]